MGNEQYEELIKQAETYSNNNQHKEAIIVCDKAIMLDPTKLEAYFIKAQCLSKIGKPEDALEYYDKIIELRPNDFTAYYNKGLLLGNLQRYEKAIVLFDKTIDLKPNDSNAYNNKGNCLRKLQRYDEAIILFDKAIELEPKNFIAYYNKGRSLTELEKYNEAIQIYEKTPKDEFFYHIGQIEIGTIYEKQKQYDKAIEYYEKVSENSPFYATAQINIGRTQGLKEGFLNYSNKKISDRFDAKVEKLEKEYEKYSNTFSNMITLTIIIAISITLIYVTMIMDKANLYLDIKLGLVSVFTLSTLLWVSKYFKRRMHETVSLKEEYEHKAILLDAFPSYSEKIKELSNGDNTRCLDFIQKVTETLNTSPSSLLLGKQKDSSTPTKEMLDTLKNISSTSSKKNDD